ncbi:MAG: ribosome small subunit-dependent GTPase A [Candidatus Margulisiibacteriota bacterium]|jgi:ribosome biogenesis GTPase
MNKSDTARVIAQHRGKYRVLSESGESWAEVAGKIVFAAASPLDYPVVGDLVKIIGLEHGNALIEEILPRKSLLKRKAAGKKDEVQPIAANVDSVFFVQAVDRDFNLNRFERYLTIVQSEKISPVLVLNKIDLVTSEELEKIIFQVKDRFKGVPLITTSVLTGSEFDRLAQAIKPGQICCFLGSSGVGKSSLTNKLLGEELITTKEISAQTKKGKHTTTHRELFVLKNGGMIIDNPGMREIGLADAEEGLKNVFAEIEEIGQSCKFIDCTHQHEPGCAVLAALKSGSLSEEKYRNYLKLKNENDYYAMTNLEKRQRDKDFGKMVKSALKEVKKRKPR